MMAILVENGLLLLFLVAALGYGLGGLRLYGSSLGVAAVLFVGLAFGALDPALQIPDAFFNLGLVLFVYTIGLSNGPGFFARFRREGLRDLLFIVASLFLPGLLLLGLYLLGGLTPANAAGLFAGLSTNTPALAGVLDYLQNNWDDSATAVSQAVVGFSVVYPMGVLGRMMVIALTQRWWQIDYAAEAYRLRKQYPIAQEFDYRTITITRPEATAIPLRQLQEEQEFDLIFGRLYRGDDVSLIRGDTHFQLDDQIVVAGTEEEMDRVETAVGQRAPEELQHDKAVYASRRLFVSNPDIAGQPISALKLRENYGALVSHVRRGDVELLANGNPVLELGDRIRVLAPREEIPKLVTLVGDSYATLSQVNLLTLGLGITLGLLLGLVPIPLPGGVTFRLGAAGGPLLVALVLGALRRTGPILWTLPYSANLTLRQIGLICLLATIGVRSGNALLGAFADGSGWLILAVGTLLVVVTTYVALLVGYKWLRIPYSLLIGMISPQPAVLGYALEQSGNSLPTVGYTLMFPFSIIINVTLAQILLIILQNLGI
jgi:putative transport protein